MNDWAKYPRAPSVEAVFELRFPDNFSTRDLTRLRERFQRQYPSVDEVCNFEVKLEEHAEARSIGLAGYKMTAANAVDILLIQESSLASSRMAPYFGWEMLIAKAKENFEILSKVIGYKHIIRLGSRFVNRIDLPADLLRTEGVDSLFNLGIRYPSDLEHIGGQFNLAANLVEKTTGVKILVQLGPSPEALIDHVSVALDIDASIDRDIPVKIQEVWALAEKMRIAKNKVFESIISPRVRELFT